MPADAHPEVRPGTATGELPPMAGRLVGDGDGLCFIPRFAFLDGTAYSIAVDGALAATLMRDRPWVVASTEVTGIYPTAAEVPRNLLRFYVWFSAPMSEDYVAGHVRLADDHGSTITGALLPSEHELWDSARRRLTVLLDPARIKRGLAAHCHAGYPLRAGEQFSLVVGSGIRDAHGLPLRAGTQRRYQVGDDERSHVDPWTWGLTAPRTGTFEPVQACFDRPLDHGLLTRCLHVTGPDRQLVRGTPQIGTGETSWQLIPGQAWASGPHQLIIDPILEDQAGNSVSRVFDRDLSRPQDRPRPTLPVTLTFNSAE
ncbi:MAG TPA: hypothetical protein VGM14_18990 [Streptosporangiaceae bacterium]